MLVVSNTSPLINLASVGQTGLLTKLFGSVTAPEMVRLEMESLRVRATRFAAVEISSIASFVPVKDRSNVALLSLHLDPGEAEAIALAVELKADLLLLDERRATRTAHRLGLKTLGLLGVLVQAKRKGYLNALAPVLNQLEVEAGFWVGETLRKLVLKEVGE